MFAKNRIVAYKGMLEYNLLISLCLTTPFSSTNLTAEGILKTPWSYMDPC